MLSKKHRLPTSFFRARKHPSASFTIGGIGVRVYVSALLYPRCAVVVPVKTAKKAVDRNKIRRMIYDTIRAHIAGLPVYDIVFFVSRVEGVQIDINAALRKLIHNT